MSMSFTRCARATYGLGVAAAVLWLAPPAVGIVVSDDPANHEVTPPSDYDMVGLMVWRGDPGSTAILIDPWHILTAAHALYPGTLSDHRFELHLADGTHEFQIAERFIHDDYEHGVFPTVDVAVGRLDRSTGLSGYGLYALSNEVGKIGVLVGYGMSGTGLTGQDPNYPKGTKRSGQNHIGLKYTPPGETIEYLLMDFDGPAGGGPLGGTTLGAALEVMFASGDSGGPTFVSSGGNLLVAGLNITLSDQNANGKIPDFGDLGWALPVSQYRTWITNQIPPYKTLTIDVVNDGWGDVTMAPLPTDPNQPEFPSGVEVTLTAEPQEGRGFGRWLIYDPNWPGDANHALSDTNSVLTIVMDEDRQVQATFKCGTGVGPLLAIALAAAATIGVIRRITATS